MGSIVKIIFVIFLQKNYFQINIPHQMVIYIFVLNKNINNTQNSFEIKKKIVIILKNGKKTLFFSQ